MDDLTYAYTAATNRLSTLSDAAVDGGYTGDIKGTTAYAYDQIGNLTSDGSNAITWTVYGKIATQTGTSGQILYAYDASSNRITKTTSAGTTLYVRDAQGNVLTTYQYGGSGAYVQSEIDLYGSSRLGLTRAPAVPSVVTTLTGGVKVYLSGFTRGLKSYELSNHLGNVLATITDKKIAVSSGSNSSLIDFYTADVVTAQDYYPFGMQMPGRTFVAAGAGNYRYGFNGKENDNEVKGVGDQIDYGMRVYDPRVGRFLSVDPLTKDYAEYSP
jgi:RHS repeat-associated protein